MIYAFKIIGEIKITPNLIVLFIEEVVYLFFPYQQRIAHVEYNNLKFASLSSFQSVIIFTRLILIFIILTLKILNQSIKSIPESAFYV